MSKLTFCMLKNVRATRSARWTARAVEQRAACAERALQAAFASAAPPASIAQMRRVSAQVCAARSLMQRLNARKASIRIAFLCSTQRAHATRSGRCTSSATRRAARAAAKRASRALAANAARRPARCPPRAVCRRPPPVRRDWSTPPLGADARERALGPRGQRPPAQRALVSNPLPRMHFALLTTDGRVSDASEPPSPNSVCSAFSGHHYDRHRRERTGRAGAEPPAARIRLGLLHAGRGLRAPSEPQPVLERALQMRQRLRAERTAHQMRAHAEATARQGCGSFRVGCAVLRCFNATGGSYANVVLCALQPFVGGGARAVAPLSCPRGRRRSLLLQRMQLLTWPAVPTLSRDTPSERAGAERERERESYTSRCSGHATLALYSQSNTVEAGAHAGPAGDAVFNRRQ